MVGENDATYWQSIGDLNFKRVALSSGSDRAGDQEACSAVIEGRGKDENRSAATLFVADSRAERDPKNMPSVGQIGH